jgi:hypothetical protein
MPAVEAWFLGGLVDGRLAPVEVDETRTRALVRRTDQPQTPPIGPPQRPALETDVTGWIEAWIAGPKPFVWIKTADDILETIAACCQRINDPGH